MSEVPVVFIESAVVNGNTNRPQWLAAARAQAQAFNDTVLVIGDGPHDDVALSQFKSRFAPLYQHLSTNHYSFELFCFERWFVLLEFMQQHDLDVVLYLDSDVLLFTNAEQEWEEHWRQFPFTLALGSSPATSFITRHALVNFIVFVSETYDGNNPQRLQQLYRTFAAMRAQNLPGGISDMALWRMFAATQQPVGEMTELWNGSTWDHNINASDGYQLRDGVKELHLLEGMPYGLHLEKKSLVRFKALHFQGGAKPLLSEYVTPAVRVAI